jgi:transposase
MSFGAKRELLLQVSARSQEARHQQKSIFLDEFSAATGYARKCAIRLLTRPAPPPAAAITRPRACPPGLERGVADHLVWALRHVWCCTFVRLGRGEALNRSAQSVAQNPMIPRGAKSLS